MLLRQRWRMTKFRPKHVWKTLLPILHCTREPLLWSAALSLWALIVRVRSEPSDVFARILPLSFPLVLPLPLSPGCAATSLLGTCLGEGDCPSSLCLACLFHLCQLLNRILSSLSAGGISAKTTE